MTEWFVQLLTGVTAAALLGCAAMRLAGGGALREIVRLAASLAVLLAVLQPLAALPGRAAGLRGMVEEARRAGQVRQPASAATDLTGRYIQARAAELGAQCTAAFDLAHGENGVPVVTRAVLTCDTDDPETLEKLGRMVETECGIPREMQTWNTSKNR